MDVIELVKNPAKCDELIHALDKIAKGVSSYEYGLPTYDEAQMARLREAIYRWAISEQQ